MLLHAMLNEYTSSVSDLKLHRHKKNRIGKLVGVKSKNEVPKDSYIFGTYGKNTHFGINSVV